MMSKTLLFTSLVKLRNFISQLSISYWFVLSFYLVTGRRREAQSAGIVFTHEQIVGFFAPQGRYVAPMKVKFGREEWTVGQARAEFMSCAASCRY